MIVVYYENHRGGVNNLAVALDRETGYSATSLNGKASAIRNLQWKIKRRKS